MVWKCGKAFDMDDNQPNGSSGFLILVPALLLCCLGPVLLASASIGGLSFLSGVGAYLSIGFAALAAIGAIMYFGGRKRRN